MFAITATDELEKTEMAVWRLDHIVRVLRLTSCLYQVEEEETAPIIESTIQPGT